MNIFGCAHEYIKDCAAAYKLMLKSPDHPAFSLEDFKKLEYLVSRSRYLVSNLSEQYKLYETSLENKEKNIIANLPSVTDPNTNSIFHRLSEKRNSGDSVYDPRNRASPKRTAKISTKEEALKSFIDGCLHKIYPKRNESLPDLKAVEKR
jgi:hypothetical protein